MGSHLGEIILWVVGGVLFLASNKWTFGGWSEWFRSLWVALLAFGLVCSVAVGQSNSSSSGGNTVGAASPQAYCQVTYVDNSVIGQGGGPMVVPYWSPAFGGAGLVSNTSYPAHGMSISYAWVPVGVSPYFYWNGSTYVWTVLVYLYQFQGYWQGSFEIAQMGYNGAIPGGGSGWWPNGCQCQTVLVQVIDTPSDRHVELDVGNQVLIVHGQNGDNSSSTVFNRQVAPDKDGVVTPFSIAIQTNPNNPGQNNVEVVSYSQAVCGFPWVADGTFAPVNGVNVQQQYGGGLQGGVTVYLPSASATQPATTQATSQPGQDNSPSVFTSAMDLRASQNNQPIQLPFHTYGYISGGGSDGPVQGDMPWRSTLSAFINPNDVLLRNQSADAAAAMQRIIEFLDPGMTAPGWNEGGSMVSTKEGLQFPSIYGWQDFGIHDGFASVIGYVFAGMVDLDQGTSSMWGVDATPLLSFGRMFADGVIVLATVCLMYYLFAWGLGLRSSGGFTPPVGEVD